MMNNENVLNDEWLWKRSDRLLRPENTPDGRDVIELKLSVYDKWNNNYMTNIEYIFNELWLWMRVDRLLRPENTPDGRDVIEL